MASVACKVSFSLLISVGKDGPYISESKIPTFNPIYLKVEAKLTAIVLFPTPPLQLDTAIIFLTFNKFDFLSNP